MNIMVVDNTKIDGLWEQIQPYIKRVMDTQSKHNAVEDNLLTIEQTKEYIKSGKGMPLVIFEDNEIVAFMMTEVLDTDAGKSLNLTTLAGTRIHEWNMMLLCALKGIAEKNKCDDIRIYMVRPGWLKAMKPYGFIPIGDKDYCGKLYPCLSYGVNNAD